MCKESTCHFGDTMLEDTEACQRFCDVCKFDGGVCVYEDEPNSGNQLEQKNPKCKCPGKHLSWYFLTNSFRNIAITR